MRFVNMRYGLGCRIACQKARPQLELESFVFNCFEVKLDFVNQVAVLEDEFDVSPSGTLQLPLDEFLRRLG